MQAQRRIVLAPYGEPLSEARTPLAALINNLLGRFGEFAPDIGQLTLDRRSDLREGETELIRPTPADRSPIDENRVGTVPWENAQLHLGTGENLNRAENTAASWRQVGQISVTGQHLSLHREVTTKLNVNTFMFTMILHVEFGLRTRSETGCLTSAVR